MVRIYGPGPGLPPPLVSTSDLAGLSTSDVEGSPVGELVGALSEEATGLIRYLDVSIRNADKHVLVPIGHARIDRDSVPPRVRLRAATHEDLLSVPAYPEEEGPPSPGFQEEVVGAFGQLFYGSRYYAHPAYDHAALQVGDTPIVGTTARADGEPQEGLRPFSELEEFRLSSDAPELIGWTAVDEAGDDVGTIGDLLVEMGARRARYVVLELKTLDRRTLLPIGYISLMEEPERVGIMALTAEDIRLLPPYEGPLSREEENRLHAALEGRLSGERYFRRPDFRPPSV